MGERTISRQPQTEVAIQPAPHEIFDAGARLSRHGAYQGSFEGQPVSIQFNILPDYGESVRISGPMFDVVALSLYETYQSSGIQYKVTGEVPQDILEMLSNLKPQN